MLRDVRIKPHNDGGSIVPGIVHDLSPAGVGISTSLRLACGDRFTILIGGADQRSTSIDCRVIHVYPVTNGWWAIGAEFVQDANAQPPSPLEPRCA
jgi:hypothetical protein